MRRRRGPLIFGALMALVAIGGWLAINGGAGEPLASGVVARSDGLVVVALLPLFGFFAYLAVNQGRRHDQLIREGRREEIRDEMMR